MSTIKTAFALRLLALISACALLNVGWQSIFHINNIAYANSEASTLRVSPTGTDASACGSEASPCRTIQYAVNKAASGDT
ncbi:MAG: hypothetical protein PHD58_06055, partial [Anaerolineales bacterium]|nr:hypothetical protein [Anaerolineales bacterium]